MPETYWPFERLGIIPKLKKTVYPRKYSVQFFSQTGKASRPFYFYETNDHDSSVTWQVPRPEFDAMLLKNAREHGVDVREGSVVKDVLTNDHRVIGVRVQFATGETRELSAHVTIDATGLSAMLSRKFKLMVPDRKLKKAALYTYFKGGHRDTGKDEGATLIISTPGKSGWFWYIPLADDIISVGVVGEKADLFSSRRSTDRSGNLEDILQAEIEKCAPIRERLEQATRCRKITACSDFSYVSRRIAGDGYVLIGDAFGFLDPIYSSGVYLALKSAEFAADCIHEAFRKQDFSAAQLSAFGPAFLSAMNSIRNLVYAFYEKDFSFGQFLNENPQYKTHIVDLLTGNVFRDGIDDIFDRMKDYIDLPEPYSLDA